MQAIRILVLGMAALLWAPLAAQETRTAPEGHTPPPATLEHVDWLIGQWTGEGIGGAPAQESWLPPAGGTMVGTFVQEDGEGGIRFTEHIYLIEEDGTLVLRLKHFNADLTGWEEKDDMLTFRLIAIEPCAAFFNALTLRCDGDASGKRGLLAAVRMQSGGELTVRFRLAGTPSAARTLCGSARNDAEADACSVAIADRAEIRRKEYRDAALVRFADNPEIAANTVASEDAYEAYRTRECLARGEALAFVRVIQESACRRQLDDARARTLWQNWLYRTAVYDSGLPEPLPTQ